MIAPILAFTSDEIWGAMPHKLTDNAESVLFNDMVTKVESHVDSSFVARWDTIFAVRGDVQKAVSYTHLYGSHQNGTSRED